MRLFTETNNSISVGSHTSHGFGIASNAKAFRVISDNIYQNKIGSLIRETACNGLDSHTQNGNPETPLLIHLPDSFEPWYSVKDYGLGMSPEFVDSVFKVYFKSTKDQSNDTIGAFGLGAKTPFAYTDKFSVVTIWNGKLYTFAAYYNSNGEPMIDLMLEEDTDQPNGVEIIVPVNANDFRTFRNELRNQLSFFPVKPNVINCADFEWNPEPKFNLDTASMAFVDNDNYAYTNAYAIQGPVGYTVDVSLLLSKVDEAMSTNLVDGFTRDHYKFLSSVLNANVWFKFNIGEIGVIASREGIEYTEFTIKNFMLKIIDARQEVIDYINNSISIAKNDYERVLILNRLNIFDTIINSIKIDAGNAIKSRYSSTWSFSIRESLFDSKKITEGSYYVNSYSRNHYTSGLKSSKVNDIVLIPNENDEMVIILRDTTTRPIVRLRKFFDDNPSIESAFVINSYGTVECFANDDIPKIITDCFGGYTPKIVKLSECPDPPVVVGTRKRTSYSRPTAYKLNSTTIKDTVTSWGRIYENIDSPDFSLKEDGDRIERAAYVVVDRQRIISSFCSYTWSNLRKCDMLDIEVFGIREADVEKLAKSDIEWIFLDDYLKQQVDLIKSDDALKKFMYASSIIDCIENVIDIEFIKVLDINDNGINRLKKIHEKATEYVNNSKKYSRPMQALSSFVFPSIYNRRFTAITQNFWKKVPLINYYDTHTIFNNYDPSKGLNDKQKHTLDYINWALSR